MSKLVSVSENARLRLARYHCFLEELLHTTAVRAVTSREMSTQLGVTEEVVRSDLSHVPAKGRAGAGYDVESLHAAVAEFLGLSDQSPFVVVASLPMLEALPVVFPASEFGMVPIAYFSPDASDAGCVVGGLRIQPLADITSLRGSPDNLVALVACDPSQVDDALEALSTVGVNGVLMLTPRIRPLHPSGMQVTYFRIPCALKSLAASSISGGVSAQRTGSCCAAKECVTASD